jgi:hypothetical protein
VLHRSNSGATGESTWRRKDLCAFVEDRFEIDPRQGRPSHRTPQRRFRPVNPLATIRDIGLCLVLLSWREAVGEPADDRLPAGIRLLDDGNLTGGADCRRLNCHGCQLFATAFQVEWLVGSKGL